MKKLRHIRRLFASHDTGRFVILTVPRTGSNLLAEMLDSHPEILCHTEVFNPKSTYLSRKPHLSIGLKEERDQNPWRFLERLYNTTDGAQNVGFKMMPFHRDSVLLGTILAKNVRKIVLTRRNWLHTYVSNRIALNTKQYHLPASSDAPKDPSPDNTNSVYVNTGEFRAYLRKIRIYYGAIRTLEFLTLQRFFWLDYAEIKDDAVIAELMQFLDVPSNVVLEERLRKQNTSALSKKISNYAEVEASLAGTRYEGFLSDHP